jgi:threonine dehydrogenase-like Zn-dependent dehydrogenase
MKAICWNGTKDVRVETVNDPTLVNPRDAIIETERTATCGSHLHLYNGNIPTMKAGDILGRRTAQGGRFVSRAHILVGRRPILFRW